MSQAKGDMPMMSEGVGTLDAEAQNRGANIMQKLMQNGGGTKVNMEE